MKVLDRVLRFWCSVAGPVVTAVGVCAWSARRCGWHGSSVVNSSAQNRGWSPCVDMAAHAAIVGSNCPTPDLHRNLNRPPVGADDHYPQVMETVGTSGHLFVIHGRLQDVACDAVIIPTDTAFSVRQQWWDVLGHPDGPPHLPDGWSTSHVARFDRDERFWFVDVTDGNRLADMPFLVRRVEEALRRIRSSLGQDPVRKRARHLITMPLLGTGGGAQQSADVIRLLFRELAALASDIEVDLAVVILERDQYVDIQVRRRGWTAPDPNSLARELGSRACDGDLSVVIGAGVSAGAGLPDWDTLLGSLSGRLHGDAADLVGSSRFRSLVTWDQAELLRQLLGDDFASSIVEAIGDKPGASGRRPSLSHFLLAGMRCRQVATTNYDLLYERAVRSQGHGMYDVAPAVVPIPYGKPQAGESWILKLHGDVEHPDDIVLSRSAMVAYDGRRRPAGSLFQAMLMTSHVLFVGVSMNDDNVLRLTHEVARMMPGTVLGTVLSLGADPVRHRLWEGMLDWRGVCGVPETTTGDSAVGGSTLSWDARQLEVLLDQVAMWSVGTARAY